MDRHWPHGVFQQKMRWVLRGPHMKDLFLAILLVTLLGWWKREPFKWWKRDLQRSGMKRSRLESPGWDCFVATKTLPLLKQLRKRPADVRQFDLEKFLNTFFVALQKLENNFWLSSTSITKNPGVENVGIDWKFPSSTGSTSIPLSQNCKHS